MKAKLTSFPFSFKYCNFSLGGGGGGGGRQVQERYKVVTFPTFLTMIVADKF